MNRALEEENKIKIDEKIKCLFRYLMATIDYLLNIFIEFWHCYSDLRFLYNYETCVFSRHLLFFFLGLFFFNFNISQLKLRIIIDYINYLQFFFSYLEFIIVLQFCNTFNYLGSCFS